MGGGKGILNRCIYDGGFSYKGTQRKYLEKALEIAVEHEITLYDSLFVALALENDYELITCDKKQISVAAKLGVKTIEC